MTEEESAKKTMKKVRNPSFFDRIAPVLLIVCIVLTFFVGMLWQKVQQLESRGLAPSVAGSANANTNPAGQAVEPERLALGKLPEAKMSIVNPLDLETEYVRGSRDAEVFFIEYSDFQCPFCVRFHPTVKQVLDEYQGRVSWVYRHMPLEQIHPQAKPAAHAAECVGELGGADAFWKFGDLVFNDQTLLQDLGKAATQAGVNKAAFDSCQASGKYNTKVKSDSDNALDIGLTGTPGTIVTNKNGGMWVIPGALPYEQIKAVIDEALKG